MTKKQEIFNLDCSNKLPCSCTYDCPRHGKCCVVSFPLRPKPPMIAVWRLCTETSAKVYRVVLLYGFGLKLYI